MGKLIEFVNDLGPEYNRTVGSRDVVLEASRSELNNYGWVSTEGTNPQVFVGSTTKLNFKIGAKLEELGLEFVGFKGSQKIKVPRSGKVTPEQVEEVLKMIKVGKSAAQTSREMGISSYIVYKLIDESGVENRFAKRTIAPKYLKEQKKNKG